MGTAGGHLGREQLTAGWAWKVSMWVRAESHAWPDPKPKDQEAAWCMPDTGNTPRRGCAQEFHRVGPGLLCARCTVGAKQRNELGWLATEGRSLHQRFILHSFHKHWWSIYYRLRPEPGLPCTQGAESLGRLQTAWHLQMHWEQGKLRKNLAGQGWGHLIQKVEAALARWNGRGRDSDKGWGQPYPMYEGASEG